MELWLKIALLVFLFTIFFPYHPLPEEPFQRFIDELHPYSGLEPDRFRSFVANIKHCDSIVYTDPKAAANALYQALEDIREMSLYNQRADQSELYEELNGIADRVALTGEGIIQRMAIRYGVRFFPKYLNDKIPEDLNDPADSFRPGGKATGSLCTTGSCRG
jgi:hypothetical protein